MRWSDEVTVQALEATHHHHVHKIGWRWRSKKNSPHGHPWWQGRSPVEAKLGSRPLLTQVNFIRPSSIFFGPSKFFSFSCLLHKPDKLTYALKYAGTTLFFFFKKRNGGTQLCDHVLHLLLFVSDSLAFRCTVSRGVLCIPTTVHLFLFLGSPSATAWWPY